MTGMKQNDPQFRKTELLNFKANGKASKPEVTTKDGAIGQNTSLKLLRIQIDEKHTFN